MLSPLKPYLTARIDPGMSDIERSLRPTAVSCSLKLMGASRRLFDCIFPFNPKFHFVVFLIFDTAAFLCSAVIHDYSRSLPQRDNVVEAIGMGLNMIEQVRHITKTGTICYAILTKLVANLSVSSLERIFLDSMSVEGSNVGLGYPEAQQNLGVFSPGNFLSPNAGYSLQNLQTGISTSESLNLASPEMEPSQLMGLGDLSNMDIGGLGQIWGWENLDLDFSFPQAT